MRKYIVLLFGAFSIHLFGQIEEDFAEFDSVDDIEFEGAVITGTMKEVSRLDSPVPVEVITSKLFQKNPSPSLFDAIGMVNGVRPQINCNVCNTGDIQINGMQGPYTMILIDGMPIVSALSTVYGLNGIPNSMVERIEVVKGPASSLYGSEAMGGIINIITKDVEKAPQFSADFFTTSWLEYNTDFSTKFKVGKASSLLGINYFQYINKVDNNDDNFTDLTLQDRISIFNKWNFNRKENRKAGIGLRYVYEDRWGGELEFDKRTDRGSDEVYGESVFTSRFEAVGNYQLPLKERIYTQFSYNYHDQDSWYGDTPYKANQQVLFGQIYWDKSFGKHHILAGASLRYTLYDDNTPATASADGNENEPSKTILPGIFIQDEIQFNPENTLLLGYRYDYDENHGSIHSPRLAYKWNSFNKRHTLRGSFGTGFRVVNLFTEDHAALTGSREVIIKEQLKPEKSYNANLNYVGRFNTDFMNLDFDLTGFYSYFTNKILGDYDVDPNQIVYQNLKGHAISQGISLNLNFSFGFPLRFSTGITYMDVFRKEKNEENTEEKIEEWFAPKWSGIFVATYTLPKNFTLDITGNWNGPMRLPIHPKDYRPEYSPWFCIANVQISKKFNNGIELYGGIKNLFDFVPSEDPLMRAFDPFDQFVEDPINNPHGYTFDTTYNYASLQGIRGFLGIRYAIF
ncbi:MAG: TonB-dependent receptor [Flavobacteriaceae bacterium]|jgi:outer membrane receptor for ferrienterochelin and colicins|nr:TonB-dependent receptor [Flavobacteriaceae bacterium]